LSEYIIQLNKCFSSPVYLLTALNILQGVVGELEYLTGSGLHLQSNRKNRS